jgi:hypothetical protein
MGFLFALPLSFENYYWNYDEDNNSRLIITFESAAFEQGYFVAAFLAQTVFVSIISIAYGSLFVSLRRKNNQVLYCIFSQTQN